MKTLLALPEDARADPGDNLTGRKGARRREPGRVATLLHMAISALATEM